MRFAINPLQWDELDPSGVGGTPCHHSREVLRAIHTAGFTAVPAEPEAFGSAAACARMLTSCGLEPAPGYFSAPLSSGVLSASERDSARRFAAAQAELELTEACLADDLLPARIELPNPTADLSAAEIDRTVTSILAISGIWREEGLEACIHNHVGTGIQTEAETDAVLAGTARAGVQYCPDTGHLAWAGVDPAASIDRHRDRVRMLHVKDLDASVAARAAAEGWGYGAAVIAGLWQEPGYGDLDLEAALPAAADSLRWIIVEVDHSTVDPQESTRRCLHWVEQVQGSSGAMIALSTCIEWLFGEEPSFPRRIDRAAAAGLPFVEFWTWRDKDLAAIREAATRTGVGVKSFVSEPQARLVDPATHAEFAAGVAESAHVAAELGCANLIVLAGDRIEGAGEDEQREAVITGLRRAAPAAAEYGVTLLLEPLNTRLDHPHDFLDSTAAGLEIVEAAGAANVRLVLDIYHAVMMGEQPQELDPQALRLVRHVHVADVPGRHEPGTGTIDWEATVDRLVSNGYDGAIGLEYMPTLPRTEDTLRVIAEAVR